MAWADHWPPDPDAPERRARRLFYFCLGVCVGALLVEASYHYPSAVPHGPGGRYLVFEKKDGRLIPAPDVQIVVPPPHE